MRLGCCMGLSTFVPTTIEGQEDSLQQQYRDQARKIADRLAALEAAGCDYAEFGVGMTVPERGEDEFALFARAVEGSHLRPEAFNSFIPAHLPTCSPDTNWERLEQYVATATQRIAGVGGELIVFGSGRARSRPEGHPPEEADRQLRHFVNMAADYMARHNLILCLEPLNSTETNMITSVAQAVELAREINRPEVRVLADLFHMEMEHEPLDHILDAGDLLAHAHVADTNRRAPGTGSYDFTGFFDRLHRINYRGRVSIEANFADFAAELALGMEHIRPLA